jgi:DNA-binding YbaB/EbfC family protein
MIRGAKVEYRKAEQAVNPFKMQEMLEQARHMQDQMQEKLSQTVVEASSGGGAVTVKMNGQKQVLQLKIDAAAVTSLSSSPADVEMLEDLVTAAFNEAGRRADEVMKSSLTGMLGGLNLPPGLL